MKQRSTKSRTILLCSDIHGNLPALEAILDATRAESIDEIWNLGDITGYAPFPVGVIELLRNRRATNIIGNYDQKVLAFRDHRDQWKGNKRSDKYAAFEWNHGQLSAEARKFLKSLPESIKFQIGVPDNDNFVSADGGNNQSSYAGYIYHQIRSRLPQKQAGPGRQTDGA